jgi:hypothetical protein
MRAIQAALGFARTRNSLHGCQEEPRWAILQFRPRIEWLTHVLGRFFVCTADVIVASATGKKDKNDQETI